MRDLRPKLHFTVDNWMNDPKPFFWNGVHHLFFQNNPKSVGFGDMEWGHAISTNLVQWERLPNALVPEPGADERGCWTGSIIEHNGEFHLFYTAISSLEPLIQRQCSATSKDLITWEKNPVPILMDSPPGLGPCWRDPQVWATEDGWKMVVGSERLGEGGVALLYGSRDLSGWSLVSELVTNSIMETGFDYECPDFFQAGDDWVFISSRGAVHWQIGSFDGLHFLPRNLGTCDGPPYGPTTRDASPYYAAKTNLLPDGRRLMWAWVRETLSNEDLARQGWAGVQAFPREIWIENDELKFAFARELTDARKSLIDPRNLTIQGPIELLTEGATVALIVNGVSSWEHSGGRVHAIFDGSILEFIVDGHPTTLRIYEADQRIKVSGGIAHAWTLGVP